MLNLTKDSGFEKRYGRFMEAAHLLAGKHGLTLGQVLDILEDINSFKKMYCWSEIEEFITQFNSRHYSSFKYKILTFIKNRIIK